MVFVLGSVIYTSINSAKRGAAKERSERLPVILQQRKELGIDAWDQKKERDRLRAERGWETGGSKE
jgi:hypothetical protein